MTEQQEKQLEAPFPYEELGWRITNTNREKTGGMAAPFVNERAIRKRLDQVLGRENWQNELKVTLGNAEASYICEISVYYPNRQEWIKKSNGAGSTQVEPVKGGISDAIKRAASMWGVGTYLYEFPGVWVDIDSKKRIQKGAYAKLKEAYARFLGEKQPAKPKATSRSNTGKQPYKGYRVVNARKSKGANGVHTYVQLEAADGRTLDGFVNQSVDVGQFLTDLKVTPKHDAIAGEYNIISCRVAA